MAEEPEAEPQEDRKPPTDPGKYLVLILAILGLEAVGGYVVINRAIPPREDFVEEGIEELESQGEFKPPLFFTDLKKMVINPVEQKGMHLVQLSLALEVDSEIVLDELKKKQAMIQDLILQRLESFPIRSIRDPHKDDVREALKRIINAELKNGEALAVYFTDIVVQ